MPIGPPILVTGSHRSGTTWVGRVLSLSGEAHLIHEPFNPHYYRSWLSAPPAHWFEHVADHNAKLFGNDVARILQLHPPPMLGRAKTPKQVAMVAREHITARYGRVRGRRPLLKDPIAFFSVEWLAAEHGCKPLVLVRDPAAFAGSLKRLDWQFDFRNLLDQRTLMEGDLAGFRREIEAATHNPPDVIGQAILLWRIFGSMILHYRQRYPDWLFWRYEDLAACPLEAFRHVYDSLDLTWSKGVASTVHKLSSNRNPGEVDQGDKGGVARDSEAAMETWRKRLTAEETQRVRAHTYDLAQHFHYGSTT